MQTQSEPLRFKMMKLYVISFFKKKMIQASWMAVKLLTALFLCLEGPRLVS